MTICKFTSLPEKPFRDFTDKTKYDRETVEKLRELHGGDREFPKFFRPFTEDEMLCKGYTRFGLLGHYSPIGMEWRQISTNHNSKIKHYSTGVDYRLDKKLPHTFSGHFFFFHNQTGIAYGFLGSGEKNRIVCPDDVEREFPSNWWFHFGCDHAGATEKNLRMCLHEYTCGKCGYVWTVDSSD